MADVDLNFLARQIDRLIVDNASIRDDLSVLTAIVLRLEGSVATVIQELRVIHSQIARMNDRIRKLEDAQPLGSPPI